MLFIFVSIIKIAIGNPANRLTEVPITDIRYRAAERNDGISLENVRLADNGLIMRSLSGHGSIINFTRPCPTDSWSFSFTFDNIDISFPSMAGIYIWYTDEGVKEGNFRGVSSKFKGMMAGIEFIGMSVELILMYNDGSIDVNDMEDVAMVRDSISHARLVGTKSPTIKIIHTKKNVRIEIYDGDKVIYDNLRFVDVFDWVKGSTGKKFAISSYYSNTPIRKAFVLREVSLYDRKESDEYDILSVRSVAPEEKIRDPQEVNHKMPNIRYLISMIERDLKEIRNAVGNIIDEPVTKLATTIIFKSKEILDSLDDIIRKRKENGVGPVSEEIRSINEVTIKVERLLEKVEESLERVNESAKKVKNKNRWAFTMSTILTFFTILLCIAINFFTKTKRT